MEPYEEEAERLIVEGKTRAARPVSAVYSAATLGAKTERGGQVITASTECWLDSHRLACVGDLVSYPDGLTSKIVSGAGSAAMVKGRPVAIVGSAIENGDKIVSSPQRAEILRFRDFVEEPIPDFCRLDISTF